jgi:hypothetical protein
MDRRRRIAPDERPFLTPRECVERYKEVFGACKAKDCNEDRARGEDYCDDHILVDAF